MQLSADDSDTQLKELAQESAKEETKMKKINAFARSGVPVL